MAASTTGAGAPVRARPKSPAARLSGPGLVVLMVVAGLVIIYATDQIVPATSERQAQLRVWLAARATGIAAYLLLTLQVTLGLVLSHPVNKSTWKLSRTIFPWHDYLWVFIVTFVAVHAVSLAIDPYAGVGVTGALIPGLSEYRSIPVALGTLALYAFLITAVTARWTRLLPPGAWLVLHRLSIVVLGLAWVHGVLAGTDSARLEPLYAGSGLVVLLAGAYRYWAVKRARPSFSTSLPEVSAR
jgi:predicted ferric reductase